MDKLFDLNIEQVLEHWEPRHALREIIANALDEQLLTRTAPIEVYQKGRKWHVRAGHTDGYEASRGTSRGCR